MFDELSRRLEVYRADGAVGASLAFAFGSDAPVTVTAGEADRKLGIPLTRDRLFKIGSCTKTFVAAALMRLAEEGKADLDDPVAKWFPDVPGGQGIAVRQLVNHRGGLPEFEYDIPMTPGRLWKPRELVDLAFKVDKQSPSGGTAVYNNTGYVLAGMLIEAASGLSLGEYVRRQILDPLGLADTWSPATETFPGERLVRGYYHRPPPRGGDGAADLASGAEMWRMEGILPYSEDLQDSTDLFPYPAAYGCGDMVSTPADMVAFLSGLFSGRLLSPGMVREMTESRASVSYPGTRLRETGAGLLLSEYSGRLMFGHQGSIPGYVTVMEHDRETGLSIAMTSNVGSGNRISFYANGLHPVLDDVIEIVLRRA
ncbi:serine hydrolase domain-containing protein [Mesorhizobium sp. 1B3]|uniref:serine hydrolase domain-containing protein n=1 Tax=Mesorhizobium sp. 1B3 TaxID=3243599 RepID=UPI003D97FB40